MTKASQSARPAVRWDEKLPLGVDQNLPATQNPGEKDVDMEDVYLYRFIYPELQQQQQQQQQQQHVDDSWQKVKISYIP